MLFVDLINVSFGTVVSQSISCCNNLVWRISTILSVVWVLVMMYIISIFSAQKVIRSSSFKCSSSVISSNFSSCALRLFFLFLSWWCFDIFRVDMTTTFVFALLKIRFVSFHHLEIDRISFSIVLIHVCRWLVLHARFNVVSSAYCRHSFSGVIYNISATQILYNIGPNIEPVKKCVSVCTKCCWKIK